MSAKKHKYFISYAYKSPSVNGFGNIQIDGLIKDIGSVREIESVINEKNCLEGHANFKCVILFYKEIK